MPICFRFIRPDGSSPTLQEVDSLICQEAGLPDNPKEWSYLYHAITLTGMAISAKYQEVTAETFDKYREVNPDAFGDEREWAVAKKFLVTDFSYSAWYQGK